jgi:LacI family repressor for deo operon, udp, cdd, tsx, nupC, and nupG
MDKKLTIRDIAEMSGVCIGTVSRVLNNKDRVHPTTRKRILAAIAKTGFRPSAIARGLVHNRTHNILLGLHNISDPHCGSVAKVIGGRCRKLGYGLLLGDSNYEPAIEAEYLRRAGEGNVDGIIMSALPAPANIPLYAALAKRAFPMVVTECPIPNVDLTCVKYDDVAVGRLAVDYLLDKGHQRIAFLQWQQDFPTVKDRHRGYVAGLAARGAPIRPEHLVTAPKSLVSWAPDVLRKLFALPDPPTAIITENEIMASICANTLLQLGKRIPADMAIVGIGSVLSSALVPLPLTVVALHHEEAMQRAVEMLVKLIEFPELRKQPPCHYIQPPQLIVGASA